MPKSPEVPEKKNDFALVVTQEMHTNVEVQLSSRDFDLLGATHDRVHSVAEYVRTNIENASLLFTSSKNKIQYVKFGVITNHRLSPSQLTWLTLTKGILTDTIEMWKYSNDDDLMPGTGNISTTRFVSTDKKGQSLPTSRRAMPEFSHSQPTSPCSDHNRH